MDAKLLNDAAKAGVYHLQGDPRQIAEDASQAGLAAFRIDIGHAHDKEDFMGDLSKALKFPATFGGNWDALTDTLRDLSWLQGKGYVIILEKSKHFAAHHKHEFDEAVDVLKEAATFWKAQGKPFWALIGGPDGWDSGCPKMPG
jgi:RNAse (barnase) inhibitor barstar